MKNKKGKPGSPVLLNPPICQHTHLYRKPQPPFLLILGDLSPPLNKTVKKLNIPCSTESLLFANLLRFIENLTSPLFY